MPRHAEVRIPSYKSTRERAKVIATMYNSGLTVYEIQEQLDEYSLATVYRLLKPGLELLREEARNTMQEGN